MMNELFHICLSYPAALAAGEMKANSSSDHLWREKWPYYDDTYYIGAQRWVKIKTDAWIDIR